MAAIISCCWAATVTNLGVNFVQFARGFEILWYLFLSTIFRFDNLNGLYRMSPVAYISRYLLRCTSASVIIIAIHGSAMQEMFCKKLHLHIVPL